MLKNYLLVALRNIRRERVYALINITGLAIGLAICLLVMAFVVDEWTFDSFHVNGNRIYRVNVIDNDPFGITRSSSTPFPLADMTTENIPEVESALQWIPMVGGLVSSEKHAVREMISFAGPNFFSVFSFPLRSGDSAVALSDPSSVVISAAFAERLFGSANPLGRRLKVELGGKTNEFVIGAVAENPPTSSSISFQLILPFSAMNRFFRTGSSWSTSWPETYVLTRSTADRSLLQEKLNAAAAVVPKRTGSTRDWQFELQPLRDIHLSPEVNSSATASSPMYTYVLCAVAFVILELACINFTTLAIGRAQRRVKEIGARKVMGAGARQIIAQILGETLIVAALAMLLALVVAELMLPHFGALAGKSFTSILSATGYWGLLAIWLVLIAAFFAGSYPALVLARVKMVDAMRGSATLLTGQHMTRVLVVLQFGVSAMLVIVTLCMMRQLNFVVDSPLGFNQERLVMIHLEGTAQEKFATVRRLRESLSSADGVLSVAASSADFTGGGVRKSDNFKSDSTEFSVFINPVDDKYVTTMGLQLVSGSDFDSKEAGSGEAVSVIVNEALVREMQWTDPIGREAPLLDDSRIIGVVKDFHIQSFNTAIEPVALVVTREADDWAESFQFAFVRLNSGDIAGSLKRLEQVWQDIAPDRPFAYEFMDQHIAAQYRSFERWASIMQNAAVLAVVVACFGVFGLSALAVTRRRKEMGIRRVLGAHARQLVLIFWREFALLTIVGNAIAVPVAYWAVNHWLAEFVYRVELTPWPFLGGMLLLLVVVLATASFQAVKASTANLAEVIRYE